MIKNLIIAAILTLFAASAAFSQTDPPKDEITTVVYSGVTFRQGDRVRIVSFAGTMKPGETAYPKELKSDKGRTGTIIRGEKRVATSYFKPDPNEPIQIVRVKWDAQKWELEDGTATSVLKPFESTIHLSYLEIITKPAVNPRPKIKRKKS